MPISQARQFIEIGKEVTSTAGGEEPTAQDRKEETISLSQGAGTQASSMTTGSKQHSLTATGGEKEVTLMARGEEDMAPARKEAQFF